MRLVTYFQNYGIKAKGVKFEITNKGGLRAVHIHIPGPKNSRARFVDLYVTESDYRGIWP